MTHETLKEIVKTDLKNSYEYVDNQQKLILINDALKYLSTVNDEKIDKVINRYREEQRKQEEILETTQKNIMENAKNIYQHLMTEL